MTVAATGRRYYHADSCVKRRCDDRLWCAYTPKQAQLQDQISLNGGVAALRMRTGCASAIRLTDHCSVALHCGLEQQSARLKQTGLVVTPAVKFEMRIIHRIINFCITATLKTGGAYYTQVRIIGP